MAAFDPFQMLREVAILDQLAQSALERVLPDGMVAFHYAVLSHLSHVGDGQAPMRIAAAMQVPRTTMSAALKSLEGRGLVERRPDPNDGRAKGIWITAAGHALMADARAALSPHLEGLTRDVGADRMAAAMPVLTEMRRWLDTERDRLG
ncbi:MAG: MarR family winged helix-turn-helix transcriptional regulator [Paracoccaceae bacterium]